MNLVNGLILIGENYILEEAFPLAPNGVAHHDIAADQMPQYRVG